MRKSVMILVICISLFLTACGAGGDAQDGTAGSSVLDGIPIDGTAAGGGQGGDSDGMAVSMARGKEWAYVPEVVVLGDYWADYGDMRLNGDTLCYVSIPQADGDSGRNVCRYSLTDKAFTSEPVDWQPDSGVCEMGSYTFDSDFNLWMLANVYPADYSRLRRFLCRFDPEGKTVFSTDVTEQLGSGIAIGGMVADGQGRLYVYTNEYTDEAGIWLYEADGSFHGRVSFGTGSTGGASAGGSQASGTSASDIIRVKGVVDKGDGSFYFCISRGENPDHCTLAEVDFESGRLTEVIEEFPNVNGFCADTTGQYDFLIFDNQALYGYNLPAGKGGSGKGGSEETAEELFVWADSDVNGYFVTKLGIAEDGRYFCMVEDWENDDRCVIFLKKTRAEDAPKRIPMVLAAVNRGSDLAAMAVKFNRGNSLYHITVKNYASLTDLYNAILAKEAIDIIDLSGLNVERLVKQGILEDLTPFLEQSEKYDASDFLDGVLEAYTFDGVLTGIPETFIPWTLVGDRRMLGEEAGEAGLTLEKLLEIARRNPDALPFDKLYGDGITREEAMNYIIMFNEDAFIDWDTGECRFDSDTFKKVLELVGRMPDSEAKNRRSSGDSEDSMPTRLQNGQVLFAAEDVAGLKDLVIYEAIFGEGVACVGFPTPDGTGGTLLETQNAFGIAASSRCKDAAWKFLESIPERRIREGMDSGEIYRLYWLPNAFPSLKRTLDIIVEYYMEEERDWAASGRTFHGQVFEDGWTYESRAVTQEDIDIVLGLPKGARPSFSMEGDAVIQIINEEVPAYYSGQKRVEDVVSIIQNRVRLYVEENR